MSDGPHRIAGVALDGAGVQFWQARKTPVFCFWQVATEPSCRLANKPAAWRVSVGRMTWRTPCACVLAPPLRRRLFPEHGAPEQR